jgi:hypothetical protein
MPGNEKSLLANDKLCQFSGLDAQMTPTDSASRSFRSMHFFLAQKCGFPYPSSSIFVPHLSFLVSLDMVFAT